MAFVVAVIGATIIIEVDTQSTVDDSVSNQQPSSTVNASCEYTACLINNFAVTADNAGSFR